MTTSVGNMKSRTSTLAFVIMIMCVATVPTVGQSQAKLPRTPDGRPDLQGIWSKATTRPWRAEFALTKMEDGQIFEYACHEGNYSISGVLAGARAQEKEAAK
jgi:hypothetical protein